MTKSSLMQIATPLCFFIIELRKNSLVEKNYQALHYYLMTELNNVAHLAQDSDYSVSEVENLKYALAATLDESLMESTWVHQQQWASQTLQSTLFGEHVAGEQFFTRLAALRETANPNRELIQVFYICLQLGFKGLYKGERMSALKTLTEQLSMQLGEMMTQVNEGLSLQTPQPKSDTSQPYEPMLKKCLIASVVLTLCVGWLYQLVLKRQCDANIELYERF